MDESSDFTQQQPDERTNKYVYTRDSLEIIEDCEGNEDDEDMDDDYIIKDALNATPEP